MAHVVIAVVRDEMEADMVCGMLAANGIRGWYQKTNVGAAIWTGTMATIGPIQVLVNDRDGEEARRLLATTDAVPPDDVTGND
jgi:Putative prokaryotic signal transducing protein